MSVALRTYYRGATLAGMVDHVAGTRRTYHLDHQGTVQCLTDNNGVVMDRFACDAWGNELKRTGTSINRQWYVGNLGYYLSSEQSVDYARQRYGSTAGAGVGMHLWRVYHYFLQVRDRCHGGPAELPCESRG